MFNYRRRIKSLEYDLSIMKSETHDEIESLKGKLHHTEVRLWKLESPAKYTIGEELKDVVASYFGKNSEDVTHKKCIVIDVEFVSKKQWGCDGYNFYWRYTALNLDTKEVFTI